MQEVEKTDSQPSLESTNTPKLVAPKVLLKQTNGAKKQGRKLPIFSKGELFPLKGVWFKLEDIVEGKLILVAQTETIEG